MMRPIRCFILLVLLPLGAGVVHAGAPDPAALQAEIARARLDPGHAVSLKGVDLPIGPGTLHLDEGVLIPATPAGGRTMELVFLGVGRVEVEPPDSVEAGQLELFTGSWRLGSEFREAVLVVTREAEVAEMLRRPAVEPGADRLRRAEALYADWCQKGQRKFLGAERSLLLGALSDPIAEGYFAAWFRGTDLGDFFYWIDPGVREQVTLGRFVPLEASEREKKRILRQIAREQRKGRLIGIDLEDLGQWDTWLSASLKTPDGKTSYGASAFEPRKYTLDVSLESDLRLAGRARLDLDPEVAGSRAVSVFLSSDFQVSKVTDPGGAPLFYLRNGGELTVILPQAPPSGGTASVVVEYSGRPVDKDWNLITLVDTMGWYPHAGAIDRAPYDVTFHWPKGLELVASGRRIDGGESPGGDLWERRALDLPAFGFSFEVGRFKVETVQAGHVAVRFAFGSGTILTGRGTREEVMKAALDSLRFYEETFGPYPLDELTVTTANRSFSQGMLGFVTLSDLVLNDFGMWNRFFGVEDRRLVVAHEIAHQWWGNQVGWTSYRDQWISEAMASYAAILFAKERMADTPLSGVGLTAGWLSDLAATLPDGRTVESIGPVVLGSRLLSSRSDSGYGAIVYKKGTLILQMLARSLGEESFPRVLKQLMKTAGLGTITTEEFFSLIEQAARVELGPFTHQFVYGTGLPEVLYTYSFEKKADRWLVKGVARQQTPHHDLYKVVRTPRGTFDVAREVVPEIDLPQASMVVPIEIEVYDPGKSKGKGKDGANAKVAGKLLLKGESTPFQIMVAHEPKAFWLDRDSRVFGQFLDEGRTPKQALYYRARAAASGGSPGEAVAIYDKALAVDDPAPEGVTVSYANLQMLRRYMNALIELGRARLLLDAGRDEEADTALGKASYLLGGLQELKILRSRLDIRRGDYERAFDRLRKGLKAGELGSSEGFALLAIAARQTHHQEEFDKALKKARENGADVSLLTASGG